MWANKYQSSVYHDLVFRNQHHGIEALLDLYIARKIKSWSWLPLSKFRFFLSWGRQLGSSLDYRVVRICSNKIWQFQIFAHMFSHTHIHSLHKNKNTHIHKHIHTETHSQIQIHTYSIFFHISRSKISLREAQIKKENVNR